MAKAQLVTQDGSKVTIEGTAEEVAVLVAKLGGKPGRGQAKTASPQRAAQNKEKQKATPINLISSLIDGGFFRKPKDLVSVKVAMEEVGHYFPVTSISPALLRLVRRRQLKRIKEKKRWLYTG